MLSGIPAVLATIAASLTGLATASDYLLAAETIEDVYNLPCSKPDFTLVPGYGTREEVRRRQIDPNYPVSYKLGPLQFDVLGYYLSKKT